MFEPNWKVRSYRCTEQPVIQDGNANIIRERKRQREGEGEGERATRFGGKKGKCLTGR